MSALAIGTVSRMATAAKSRSVVLASADEVTRGRVAVSLRSLRWTVHEAPSGAQAVEMVEDLQPEALLLDSWLPDLAAAELGATVAMLFPALEVLRLDGEIVAGSTRSVRRHELLHAVREAAVELPQAACQAFRPFPVRGAENSPAGAAPRCIANAARPLPSAFVVPGLVGSSVEMQEVARLIHMVAPCSATVLIEGETGTGKEIVARALHTLSPRANKPFVVLNCAAIPEALLEAELFGYARGAFTGAVQSRTGRIEAADGGTLFLDEIGEMPAALQAKMLRFLENGELQRVGENHPVRVHVRVVAATHRDLEAMCAAGTFRLDLYHRLAVFPLEVPPLRERLDDLLELSEHLLAQLGEGLTPKALSSEALRMLGGHDWPGNVRELAHVLQRATILAGDANVLEEEHIRYRRTRRAPLKKI